MQLPFSGAKETQARGQCQGCVLCAVEWFPGPCSDLLTSQQARSSAIAAERNLALGDAEVAHRCRGSREGCGQQKAPCDSVPSGPLLPPFTHAPRFPLKFSIAYF